MGLVVGPDGDAYYLTQDQSTIVRVAPDGSMVPIAVPGTGTATGLLAGSDGVYFEAASTDGLTAPLDRVDPDGTVTTVATGLPPTSGLAFGADGNLWWTQNLLAKVGRMVLAPVPVPQPGPSLLIGKPLSIQGPTQGARRRASSPPWARPRPTTWRPSAIPST